MCMSRNVIGTPAHETEIAHGCLWRECRIIQHLVLVDGDLDDADHAVADPEHEEKARAVGRPDTQRAVIATLNDVVGLSRDDDWTVSTASCFVDWHGHQPANGHQPGFVFSTHTPLVQSNTTE